MSIIIIAKNQTVDDILIFDLGEIPVPGSGQLNLTDVFRVSDIRSSDSLKDLITADDIIINDGAADLSKDDSLVVVQFAEPIGMFFGRKYKNKSNDSESSTTSTNWQEKASLSVSSIPAGKYRIGWCAELKQSGDAKAILQVQLDDSDQINGTTENKGEYRTHSGFKKKNLTAASHTIDIDYKQNNNGTAFIRNARIELWRID